MLKVDLGQLQREERLAIDEDVPADDPLLEGTGLRLKGPLAARLEAQQAGSDVLVRGRLTGRVELDCRRCLERVVLDIDEPVSLVYRSGLDPAEAEREEAYPLPERARDLDLGGAVREHVVLAAPKYAICDAACKGLCPGCGTNLNEGACDCTVEDTDDRWAPLRKLKLD